MARIVVTQSGTTVVVGDGDKVVIDIPGGGTVNIVADPNDDVDDLDIEFWGDDHSDEVNIDLSTFSQDDLHIDIKKYDPTDKISLNGAFNRYVDPDDTDEYTFDYVGADGKTYKGFVHAKDGKEKDFTAEEKPIIICFGRGTMIETIDGPKPVETLAVGDLVLTYDRSISPVKWIGSTHLDAATLAAWPDLRPVRVARGALGAGRPHTDTLLSPNHRILINGWRAELMFGEEEVLVPVKALVNGDDITIENTATEIDYFHLLLDGHQIVFSNGMVSESLFLGDQTTRALMGNAIIDSQRALGLPEWNRLSQAPAARPTVRAKLARTLAA